jgi:pimeloyl-ACP methyl ester carboxylesterase
VLAWTELGAPGGRPILYFYGTPGSAQELPASTLATELGARVLTFDRPGYAATAPQPDASLRDVATQGMAELAARGVDRVSVVGWSGGGPYALACAYVAPQRVARVLLLGSWAPMNPPDPGLPLRVRVAMTIGRRLPRSTLKLVLRASGRPSVGQLDDIRRISRPWGFAVDAVAQLVPIEAWHGEHDAEVPVAPWRERNTVSLRIVEGRGHDLLPDLWPEVLRATLAN